MGLLLVSCSGGTTGEAPLTGQDPTPVAAANNPQGVWTGTTSHGRTVWGVIRVDGAYWFLYSAIGDPSNLGGAIQGTSVIQGDTLSSIDTFDYSMDEGTILQATLAAQFIEKQSVTGTMTLTTGESVTFTLAYQAHIVDSVTDIRQAAGTYPGTATSSIRPPGVITMAPVPLDNLLIDATNGGSSAWTVWQSSVCTSFEGDVYATPVFEGLGHVYTFVLRSHCTNYPSAIKYGVAWYDPATNTLSLFAQIGFEARPSQRMQAFIYRGVKQ